jgi:hypothetical protein
MKPLYHAMKIIKQSNQTHGNNHKLGKLPPSGPSSPIVYFQLKTSIPLVNLLREIEGCIVYVIDKRGL